MITFLNGHDLLLILTIWSFLSDLIPIPHFLKPMHISLYKDENAHEQTLMLKQ